MPSTASAWRRATVSSWCCLDRRDAERPRSCASLPAWRSRPPARCALMGSSSTSCRRPGAASPWSSKATGSIRTSPSGKTSPSRCGRRGRRRTESNARSSVGRAFSAAVISRTAVRAQRRPRDLSGADRQRVALSRALVRELTVFLLDEPLSNLDAKLRASARSELKAFQLTVKTATIYVTHDQVEAMGLGDRIAVMDHGNLKQVGTPTEIYEHPADEFVATFLGTPPMNLIERDGGTMGFRPEAFLPKELLNGSRVQEFNFRVDRMEY